MTGPQFGRKGRTGKEVEEEEDGVSKNDIVGVAVRPWPVGERREGLLEKVCGKRRWVFFVTKSGRLHCKKKE